MIPNCPKCGSENIRVSMVPSRNKYIFKFGCHSCKHFGGLSDTIQGAIDKYLSMANDEEEGSK